LYFEESPTFRSDVCLPSSGLKNKPSKKLEEGGDKLISLASACFWLGLLFNPEDGSDTSLRNVGKYPNHTALQPKHSHFIITAEIADATWGEVHRDLCV
jgi:hypothetical protein